MLRDSANKGHSHDNHPKIMAPTGRDLERCTARGLFVAQHGTANLAAQTPTGGRNQISLSAPATVE